MKTLHPWQLNEKETFESISKYLREYEWIP
jgi:hypothetical protein